MSDPGRRSTLAVDPDRKDSPMKHRFARMLGSDSAENSIMQTISIAVSAILLAAGMVTGPSIIKTARAGASASGIITLSIAETGYGARQGAYTDSLTELMKRGPGAKRVDLAPCGTRASGETQQSWLDTCDGIRLVANDGNDLERGGCFQIWLRYKSGDVYYAQQKSFSASVPMVRILANKPWPTTPAAVRPDSTKAVTGFATDYDAACGAWPTSAEAALAH